MFEKIWNSKQDLQKALFWETEVNDDFMINYQAKLLQRKQMLENWEIKISNFLLQNNIPISNNWQNPDPDNKWWRLEFDSSKVSWVNTKPWLDYYDNVA